MHTKKPVVRCTQPHALSAIYVRTLAKSKTVSAYLLVCAAGQCVCSDLPNSCEIRAGATPLCNAASECTQRRLFRTTPAAPRSKLTLQCRFNSKNELTCAGGKCECLSSPDTCSFFAGTTTTPKCSTSGATRECTSAHPIMITYKRVQFVVCKARVSHKYASTQTWMHTAMACIPHMVRSIVPLRSAQVRDAWVLWHICLLFSFAQFYAQSGLHNIVPTAPYTCAIHMRHTHAPYTCAILAIPQ